MKSSLSKRALLVAVIMTFGQAAFAATEASAPTTAASKSTASPSSAIKEISSVAKTETVKVTAVAQPFQVAAVSGDYHKYEAMNWQNRGYSGGIKDLSINYASGDDITIDASGGAIAGNGDYKGAYSIVKKDAGYMNIDFKQFRKYYDTYGGIDKGWSPSLSRDLYLDIGHFGIEAGITMPDLPSVSVYYDHDYKDGAKSMLSWNAAVAGITTLRICPSWKEIKESVDTLGIKGDYTEKGYHFTGDQRWEISKDKTLEVQPQITSNSTTAQGNQRRQYDTTDTILMTTLLGVDKWFWGDKAFTSGAYRLEHLKNEQVQKYLAFNSNGNYIANTTTPANSAGGDAHNDQYVNSWVLNGMVNPWSWLTGTVGLKAEVNSRDGSAYLPITTTTGMSNLANNANSNTYKFAETFGLRFKAIPRAVIYSDLSFEQSQNHLAVVQWETIGANAGKRTQNRDAIIDEPEITWAVGADLQPVRFLNLTSQFRLRENSMNFHDDPVRSNPTSGQVMMKKQNIQTIGFTQRATAKLSGWAQTSFRYLLDNTKYDSRAIDENIDAKARTLSNSFIYDLSVYPMSNLSMTGSFSQFYSETKEPQSSFPTFTAGWYQPPFSSNSSTWMFATDYQPHDKVSLDGSLYYTYANNYNASNNIMNKNLWPNYESSYDQLGLTVSCKWDIREDLSVTPQYGYQRFLPSEQSGIGGAYNAQIVSLALTSKWG